VRIGFHTGTTLRTPFELDLELSRATGWHLLEVPFPKVARTGQADRAELAQRIEAAGVEILSLDLHRRVPCDAPLGARAEADLRERMIACRELGVPRIVVVPADPRSRPLDRHWAMLLENFARYAAIAAEEGVGLCVEFLKDGRLVRCLSSVLQLVRESGASQVGLVLDLVQFWCGPSKLSDLDAIAPGELALVHVADARPRVRELVDDLDRVYPGEGTIPVTDLLQRIAGLPCDPVYVLELQSKRSLPPEQVYRDARGIADALRNDASARPERAAVWR